MDIKELFIVKETDTYSSVLETFGLCKMIDTLFKEKEIDLLIKDCGSYFKIELSKSINEDDFNDIQYRELMPVVDYIEKGNGLKNAIRYSDLKKKSEIFKNFKKDLVKNKDNDYVKKVKNYEDKPDNDWDIQSNIKQLGADKTYDRIIKQYQELKLKYSDAINNIFNFYKNLNYEIDKKNELNNKFTGVQLLNPTFVKGTNRLKADSINPENLDILFYKELLQFIGSYESMTVKGIKLGKDWDKKIYVIYPKEIYYNHIKDIFLRFKPLLKGQTSIKLDIFSLMELIKNMIELDENFINKKTSFKKIILSKSINGFHTVYLKKMSQFGYSPTNISVLNIPDFIEIDSYETGKKWIEIIDEHKKIIANIKIKSSDSSELGQFIPMLQSYRQFLTTSDFNCFFDFCAEYSVFLMQNYGKPDKQRNRFVKPFKIKLLKEFFSMADKTYSKILENKGFLNIAKAIRNATINLQMMPKDARKFDIQYGMAQDLKRKSAHNDELIQYLSDFMASYNAETGKSKEKGGIGRQTIKTTDINDIIKLIDEYGSNIVGRLLSAYGFASEPSVWRQKENGVLIIKNNAIRVKDKEGKKEIKKIDFDFSSKSLEDFKSIFEKNQEIKNLGFSNDEIESLFNEASTLTEDISDDDEEDN
jgi:hypothetical protein